MKDHANHTFEQNNVNDRHFRVPHHAGIPMSADHPMPPPHHHGMFPPHIRDTFVNIPATEEFWQILRETFTDELSYVAEKILSAPAEIQLTLSAFYGFKVDFSGCVPYVNQLVECSPLLNEVVKRAFSNIWGEDNLKYVLFVYNTAPDDQVLIAVSIAMLLQNRKTIIESMCNLNFESIPEKPIKLFLHEHPSPPHHHYGPILPPRVRHSILKIQFTDKIKYELEEIYGDKLNYVLRVIESAPPEIKLTLAMLLGFKVELSECTQFISSEAVKFTYPFLNEEAKSIFTELLGNENLNNVFLIYKQSPPAQALIAVMVAKLLRNQKDEVDVQILTEGEN